MNKFNNGSVTYTVQDIERMDAQIQSLRAENEALKQELQWFRDIARESEGVIGFHLNGDIATWDELEQSE